MIVTRILRVSSGIATDVVLGSRSEMPSRSAERTGPSTVGGAIAAPAASSGCAETVALSSWLA